MNETLADYETREFSLEDLVEAARALLMQVSLQRKDGRVAAHPDGRTIRYYQTIGVVAKPLRYEGRRAVYGYRHLLQVLALKLLQAQGMSLAQIQRALLGASTSDLAAAVGEALGPGGKPVAGHPGRERAAEAALADWNALGSGVQPAEGPIRSPPQPPLQTLIRFEPAPGIIVHVDLDRVGDLDQVIERITRTLRAENGEDG